MPLISFQTGMADRIERVPLDPLGQGSSEWIAVRWWNQDQLGVGKNVIPLIMIHVRMFTTLCVGIREAGKNCNTFRPKMAHFFALQGWMQVKEDWNEVDKSISDRSGHPVLVFDNRGMGESCCTAGAYSIAQLASDVIKVADHYKLEQFDLLGFSMGGCVAQMVCAEAKKRVRKLVLVGTTHGGIDAEVGQPLHYAISEVCRIWVCFDIHLALISLRCSVLQVMQGPALSLSKDSKKERKRDLVSMLIKMGTTARWMKDNEAAAQLRVEQFAMSKRPERGARSQALALTKFNFSKKVKSIAKHQEVLILHGGKDSVMPVQNAHLLLARLRPAAQLFVFDQVGHCPYLMVPDLFVTMIVSFLTRPVAPKSNL